MKRIFLLLCLILTFAQSNAQMCTGARRDIYSFTTTERLELRNLIIDYLNSQINSSYPASDIRHFPLVYHHTLHNSMIHGTGNVIFLTWHRYYIQELENWLTDNGHNKYVPLPSWNPTTAIPDEFYNQLQPGSALLTGGAFPNLANKTITPASITPYLTPNACTNYPNENNFSNAVEVNYHNGIHSNIGGSMAFVSTAPGAAIFWIFHAWIDDIWYCYQKNCRTLTPDLYIKKSATDAGVTPTSVVELWKSPDIWVRNTNDGFINQSSETLYQTPGHVAYVYVKVYNRGNGPHTDGNGKIFVYWAQGSVGVQWQNPWDGSTTINCGGTARPLGGPIGNKLLRRVNEDFNDVTHTPSVIKKDYVIYEFAWTIPDPDHYAACFPEAWKQQHFCVLARMEDGNPMTETTDVYNNMHNSNNIAMKNISIIGDGQLRPGNTSGSILWGNYTERYMSDVKLAIRFVTPEDARLLDVARVNLRFDQATLREWMQTSGRAEGMRVNENGVVDVMQDNASIRGFNLAPNTYKPLTIDVNKNSDDVTGTFTFDLIQYNSKDQIISGEEYTIIFGNEANGRRTTIVQSNPGSGYTLYPNPTKNGFYIATGNDPYTTLDVEMYDNVGRLVKTFTGINASTMMSTETLAPGLYNIKIINTATKAVSSHKLILQ